MIRQADQTNVHVKSVEYFLLSSKLWDGSVMFVYEKPSNIFQIIKLDITSSIWPFPGSFFFFFWHVRFLSKFILVKKQYFWKKSALLSKSDLSQKFWCKQILLWIQRKDQLFSLLFLRTSQLLIGFYPRALSKYFTVILKQHKKSEWSTSKHSHPHSSILCIKWVLYPRI